MSVNQLNISGRLGRDPETRFTQDGKPICSDAWKLKKHDGRAEAAMIAFWWTKTNIRYPETITLIS